MDDIHKAIDFYSCSPDGQYDERVVTWLKELVELRKVHVKLDELLFYANTEPGRDFDGKPTRVNWQGLTVSNPHRR